MKRVKPDITHVFVAIAAVVAGLSIIFRTQSVLQLQLIFILGLAYVSISLIHHHFDRSLTIETTLEYILLASLILVVIAGVIQ